MSHPATLWHYTTAEGLKGILHERKIWLTNSSYLNDAEETELARKQFRSELQSRSTRGRTEDFRNELITQLQPREDVPGYFSPTFLCCFSEDEDSLVQWRGYGRGEGGFAIGFSLPTLFDMKNLHFGKSATWILPCNYVESEIDKFSKHVCDELLRLPIISSDDIEEVALHALTSLTWAGACVKHHAFKEEREWRLVNFDYDPVTKMEFGTGETLKPRLTYDFGGASAFKDSLTSIVVGPQRHQGLAIRSVEALLQKEGLTSAKVGRSSIPFRSI